MATEKNPKVIGIENEKRNESIIQLQPTALPRNYEILQPEIETKITQEASGYLMKPTESMDSERLNHGEITTRFGDTTLVCESSVISGSMGNHLSYNPDMISTDSADAIIEQSPGEKDAEKSRKRVTFESDNFDETISNSSSLQEISDKNLRNVKPFNENVQVTRQNVPKTLDKSHVLNTLQETGSLELLNKFEDFLTS